ncbi:MAG: hypothetical protein JW966_11150 [Anaerolineae bacterium]|nr:hypothetical protein [Anaerolineae bacterium]
MKKLSFIVVIVLLALTVTSAGASSGPSGEVKVSRTECTVTVDYQGSMSGGTASVALSAPAVTDWYVFIKAGSFHTEVKVGSGDSVNGTTSVTLPAGAYDNLAASLWYSEGVFLEIVAKAISETPWSCAAPAQGSAPTDPPIIRPAGDPMAPSTGFRGFVDINDKLIHGMLVENPIDTNKHEWGYWSEDGGYQILGWTKLAADGSLVVMVNPGCGLAFEHFAQIVAQYSVSGYSLAPTGNPGGSMR